MRWPLVSRARYEAELTDVLARLDSMQVQRNGHRRAEQRARAELAALGDDVERVKRIARRLSSWGARRDPNGPAEGRDRINITVTLPEGLDDETKRLAADLIGDEIAHALSTGAMSAKRVLDAYEGTRATPRTPKRAVL